MTQRTQKTKGGRGSPPSLGRGSPQRRRGPPGTRHPACSGTTLTTRMMRMMKRPCRPLPRVRGTPATWSRLPARDSPIANSRRSHPACSPWPSRGTRPWSCRGFRGTRCRTCTGGWARQASRARPPTTTPRRACPCSLARPAPRCRHSRTPPRCRHSKRFLRRRHSKLLLRCRHFRRPGTRQKRAPRSRPAGSWIGPFRSFRF